MKKVFVCFIAIFSSLSFAKDFYSIEIPKMGGETEAMSKYQGKLLLITNIATRCGYTPQLKGLEELYQKYKDKGLVVIGVPSNDYGEQTPEKNAEVKKFCRLNYGVSFPLSEKLVVKGAQKHELFQHLVSSGGDEIKWNFEKFLVSREGRLVKRFSSSVAPLSEDMLEIIKKSL